MNSPETQKKAVLDEAPENFTLLAGTVKRYTDKAVLFEINFMRAQKGVVSFISPEVRSLWFPLSRSEVLQEMENGSWDILRTETWLVEKNNLWPNAGD